MSTTTRVLYDSTTRRTDAWRSKPGPAAQPAATPPPATNGHDGDEKAPRDVAITTQVQCDGYLFTLSFTAPLKPSTIPQFLKRLKAVNLEPVGPVSTAPATQAPAREEVRLCPIHRVPLQQHGHGDNTWWSHPVVDDFGKPVRGRNGKQRYCKGE